MLIASFCAVGIDLLSYQTSVRFILCGLGIYGKVVLCCLIFRISTASGRFSAAVAQLVEHVLGKDEVVGSSPIGS